MYVYKNSRVNLAGKKRYKTKFAKLILFGKKIWITEGKDKKLSASSPPRLFKVKNTLEDINVWFG